MRTTQRFFLLAAFVFGMLVTISVIGAQDAVQVTTTNNLNLRGGPAKSSTALSQIPLGTTLRAIGLNSEKTWVQVDFNGTVGWVSKQYLTWTGNLDALPILGAQPPTGTPDTPPVAGEVTATARTRVNVRSGPSTGAQLLGKLSAGTTVALNGRSENCERIWVRFGFEGREGWLASWNLDIAGDLNSLPTAPCVIQDNPFFYVYSEYGAPDNHFVPSGYMADVGDIKVIESWSQNPHSGRFAIQVTYTPVGNGPNECGYGPPCKWAGVYWLEGGWGTTPNVGYNLTGYNRLTFWARSDTEMRIEFKVGGVTGPYPDTLQPARQTGFVTLTPQWQQFTIDLSGADLSYVIGGFLWVSNWEQALGGGSFYLDDIRFER